MMVYCFQFLFITKLSALCCIALFFGIIRIEFLGHALGIYSVNDAAWRLYRVWTTHHTVIFKFETHPLG